MTRTTHPSSRRLTASVATLMLGLGVVVAGCSQDAEPTDTASSETSEPTPSAPPPSEPATETTDSAPPEAQTIDITVSGNTVDPSGERVQSKVGEEIILRVTSDAPGEIHVHATPEQQLTYEAGTTDLPLTIDQPGLVDVESHTLDLVIVQLEVR